MARRGTLVQSINVLGQHIALIVRFEMMEMEDCEAWQNCPSNFRSIADVSILSPLTA
jgi:hypothetical protein